MKDEVLGEYQQILVARSTDESLRRRREGSGGAVTSLLWAGLERGLFDTTVAVVRKRGIEGEAVVVRDKRALLQAAGSRWVLVENLRLLYNALSSHESATAAAVCTPCQAHFLRQGKLFPLVERTDFGSRLALIVGLFCMGTFSQASFKAYAKDTLGIKPTEVTNVVLKGDELRIYVKGHEEPLKVSLSEVVKFIHLGCLLCEDYTAVDADISAGMTPLALGWTVLIVRTKTGEDALKTAVEGGFVEAKTASHKVIEEISQKASDKLKRAHEYRLRYLT